MSSNLAAPTVKQPLKRLQSELKRVGADAMLVSNHHNIFYLTGFAGLNPGDRESTLLVTQRRAVLFLSVRDELQGRKLPAVKKEEVQLETIRRPYNLLTQSSRHLRQGQTVLFESHDLTVFEYRKLKAALPSKLKDGRGLLERQRMIKSDDELKHLRRAVTLTDKTWASLVSWLRTAKRRKISEQGVVEKIREIGNRLGGDGLSFDPIVASGSHGAISHYLSSAKAMLGPGPLLVDLGIKSQGYHGDLTRCLYFGRPTPRFRRVYDLVLKANQRCIAAAKPSVIARELFEVAIDTFKAEGLEKRFVHALGHGVGVAIHENPGLRPADRTKLEPGMVVTIEPGLYFPGQFGVRIEDVVEITYDGCHVLSRSPRHLSELR